MSEKDAEESYLWASPAWFPLGTYNVGDVVRYEMALYRCKEAHYGESEWNPRDNPRLWEKIEK